ncbi:hypothetical protein [Cohnella thermotolerans]|uniref:hypothetical protein n=1 Tax=Cohnella thermotolerans TaxID=329858 RepID=UPI0012EB398C|nr:hypothetical protein [Cohnella thermotolerans]
MYIRGFEENAELTTLISVPERGRFGNAKYRGNYAGEVLIRLIRFLQANGIQRPYIYDPMVGGGTSRDVAEALGLSYIVDDIHNGFDVVNDDFHDTGFDLVMLHYPYWKMIDYAADLPPELQKQDMSRMEWREFIEAVSHVNYKAAAHGRFVAVLVGDIAVKGGIKSIQREMAWPGMPVRHIIKVQHNAESFRKTYNGKFIPIVTEHLLLFRTDYQPGGEMWVLVPAQYKKIDIDQYVTWKTAVKKVIRQLDEITPTTVCEGIRKLFPVKLRKTNTPEATVRRTLQELEADGYLRRHVRGIYVKAS